MTKSPDQIGPAGRRLNPTGSLWLAGRRRRTGPASSPGFDPQKKVDAGIRNCRCWRFTTSDGGLRPGIPPPMRNRFGPSRGAVGPRCGAVRFRGVMPAFGAEAEIWVPFLGGGTDRSCVVSIRIFGDSRQSERLAFMNTCSRIGRNFGRPGGGPGFPLGALCGRCAVNIPRLSGDDQQIAVPDSPLAVLSTAEFIPGRRWGPGNRRAPYRLPATTILHPRFGSSSGDPDCLTPAAVFWRNVAH